MRVRYHAYRGRLIPEYECYRHTQQRGEPPCQVIYGAGIDTAIGRLLVEAVTPLALEVALSVQQQIQTRIEEADRLRRTQVERARYEAQLARRRYLQVDNRLVAATLEADWSVLAAASLGFASLVLQFQLALVVFQETPQVVGRVEQPGPLFVVKRDGKPPEAIDADGAFLADPEVQRSRLARANLLFQLRDASHQLFFAWFRHAVFSFRV
jgi:hypothetical protein